MRPANIENGEKYMHKSQRIQIFKKAAMYMLMLHANLRLL